MPIAIGAKIPNVSLFEMGEAGPGAIESDSVFGGKKIAMFGVPGAFTPTCHQKHVPSFIESAEALKAKGIDQIVCVAVNDPFVMKEWGAASGGAEADIRFVGDSRSELAEAMDIVLDGGAVGLVKRLMRFSAIVDDGVVTALNVEGAPGEMDVTSAEKLLQQI
ncbi:MAG: peroxiredoxin [Pseudomonadota bacterium]